MAVFEKDGGYTDKAFKLDCKVHKALDDIVREAMKDGMEMEEVLYVVGVSEKLVHWDIWWKRNLVKSFKRYNMDIDIAQFKRLMNELPDDGKILIEVIKEYPDKMRFSYEEPRGYRKIGKVFVLECETVV